MTTAVPLEDQIKCAKRELKMRESVYPKLVASGRMKREAALQQIDTMQAIVWTLESLTDPVAPREGVRRILELMKRPEGDRP